MNLQSNDEWLFLFHVINFSSKVSKERRIEKELRLEYNRQRIDIVLKRLYVIKYEGF